MYICLLSKMWYHTFSISSWDRGMRISVSSRPAHGLHRVLGQLGLHKGSVKILHTHTQGRTGILVFMFWICTHVWHPACMEVVRGSPARVGSLLLCGFQGPNLGYQTTSTVTHWATSLTNVLLFIFGTVLTCEDFLSSDVLWCFSIVFNGCISL